LFNSTKWTKDPSQTNTSISKEALNKTIHFRKFMKECVLG
jgi:hypothetical protein